MNKQIEKKTCQKCLHYCACLRNSEYYPERPCFSYEDKADYRKASEVAREIFAEIEEARERWEAVYSRDHFGYGDDAYGYLETDVDHTIYELKKKYEVTEDV